MVDAFIVLMTDECSNAAVATGFQPSSCVLWRGTLVEGSVRYFVTYLCLPACCMCGYTCTCVVCEDMRMLY